MITQPAKYDVAVIGGGPAGMAAALAVDAFSSSYRAQLPPLRALSVALVERSPVLGGILNQCTHQGFGLTYFGEELTGQEYAARFAHLIESSGVEVFTDTMILDVGETGVLTLSSKKTGLTRLQATAVILATGCRERPIGALPVAGTRPAGVYSAGMAQKMMNLGGYDLGDRFIVLGSGDVGMIVARHLVQSGKEVIAVVEKEPNCGGLPRNRINCLEKYGIPLLTSTTVSRVHGTDRITGVTLTNVSSGSHFSSCDTLITSVGLIPERDLLDSFLSGKNSAAGSDKTSQAGDDRTSPQKFPNWLFLCGNACYVHDVVDDVTVESERVGRYAAEYVSRDIIGSGGFAVDGSAGRLRLPADVRVDNANLKADHEPAYSGSPVCVACPKGCVPKETLSGWRGLACGRDAPVFE